MMGTQPLIRGARSPLVTLDRAQVRDPFSGALSPAALAAVWIDGAHDGVAYVARLLSQALEELAGTALPRLVLAHGGAGVPGAWDQFRFCTHLLLAQMRGGADWWMFSHLGLARAQLRVPARVRRPYAVFLHGIEVWEPKLSEDRKRALRGAALLVSNSGYTARRIATTHPELPPVRSCPLGLLPTGAPRAGDPDTALLRQVAPRSVLIVGRMSASERYKGHDQLIECWPRVRAEIPDAQLVVAGRGDDAERLHRKVRETGVGESVLFTGFVSDATLQALLRRAALFAMPSRGEGFGLVYLEAMRAGLACVGSTADAAVDVIVDGETGRLVDPDDRGALADALIGLLQNADRRGAMGAAGRRRFEEEFTYERFRDRLLPLLVDAFGTEGMRST